MPEVIREKKVVVVEGKDEIDFFESLLRYLEITDVEVHEVAGKGNFKRKLPALVRMHGFSDVEALVVIRDADNDANAAFDSIRNLLIKQDLDPPEQVNQFSQGEPKIGIFIMPGNSDTGMLEDLCLKTVKNHPAMECVEIFIDCASKLDEMPKNLTKAKAQAFLAAMPEPGNTTGIGALKGYWDFDSEELTDLKTFVNNLR